MNGTDLRRRILAFGAVVESLTGLALLAAPSVVAVSLLGAPLEGAGLVIGRIAGGALLAIGIACWSARNTPTSPAGRGVSWGFLVYNAVACITLALAAPAWTNGGFPALSTAVLHGVLAVALLATLLGRFQATDRP